MDLNIVALAGRLASAPEITTYESGSTLARYLVIVRSHTPNRRIDVVPVALWGADEKEVRCQSAGTEVWVVGTVQRRFWQSNDGRRSKLEVVAHEVKSRVEGSFGHPTTA
jgi:single-stranded DNA-binding protein